MNLHYNIPCHKRGALAALAALAAPALLWAQVSLYQYSESVGTYTEVTADQASYSLGVPTYWPPLYNQRAWVNNAFFEPDGQSGLSYLNPAIGPGYPIGFDFTYNGEVFDVLSVSNSGFITFGKSSDGNQAVWTYSVDHPHGMPFVQYIGGPAQPYKRNRVAGWGNSALQMQDLSSLVPPGPVSSIRLATIGTAPNRVCVVQFKDFRLAYSNVSNTLANFQIRLNEADNSVEVQFGNVVFGDAPGGNAQIGLGGSIPQDFNSRMTVYEEPAFLYDWNITVAGALNTDGCMAAVEQFGHPNGSGVPPVEGRTFKWTPDACPPPAWPLTVTDITFESATAQWEANAAGEYEYFVTDTNDVNGPEVSSGTTTDPEAFFFGLEASTTYYVFVRSICGGEPGIWSLATTFETMGGGIVVCDGTVMTEDYCSQQFSTKEWLYNSADGSPLKIEFLGGFVGNAGTESFRVWDGTSSSGTEAPVMGGNIAGHSFQAGSSIYIRLITDAGACEAQPWYLPLQWRIGCKNCLDPLASFSVVEDCANMQYSVAVDINNLGSATSVSLENSLGVPPTIAGSTGQHLAGPFPAGQSVVVTVQNPDNVLCYAASAPMINEPCAQVDCGPTTYTYCYHDNEFGQWAYQGEAGQEIGIRFLAGTVGLGDQLRAYNGLNVEDLTPENITGGLANKLITSGAPSTDRAVVLELQADDAVSCVDEDPLFGTSEEWRYVVACYDGCTQPKATFARNCLNSTQFEVEVTITQVGTDGATITNDGGVANVAVTGPGSYTVGPFASGTPVTLEVDGGSILCTWTSAPQDRDCTGVGIEERGGGQLAVYPNPSHGTFQLELPADMNGTTHIQVTDLTGRMVARETMNGRSTTLHLEHLPNGLYTVVAQGSSTRFASPISIQH